MIGLAQRRSDKCAPLWLKKLKSANPSLTNFIRKGAHTLVGPPLVLALLVPRYNTLVLLPPEIKVTTF